MSVRAKFFVTNVTPAAGATAAVVQMGAVCRGVENAMWASATPSASLSMTVKNDLATAQFEQGAEYEVTFRKVAKPAPGDGHSIVEAVNMHGGVVCETCGLQLGYTQEAAEKQAWLKEYATPEYRADTVRRHAELYGAK